MIWPLRSLAAFLALPHPPYHATPSRGSAAALEPYTISTSGINATFIGYGATMTHVSVYDRLGAPRDIVVGFDDPAEYAGIFHLDGKKYQVPANEHGGGNSLHGGAVGYDALDWTVTHADDTSVTFSLYDPDGMQGMPGAVLNHVTYAVASSPARLTVRIVSLALSKRTPLLVSTHNYWNLGGFTTSTILNDTLHMPFAKRTVDTDRIQVPTGGLTAVKSPRSSPGYASPLDFTSPKQIWHGALHNDCGEGCEGIDNAFILDPPSTSGDGKDLVSLQWSSPLTGIEMTLRTDQPALQVYSCVFQDGKVKVKSTQRGGVETVEKYGCLVLEPQQWIDGVNHPEWGQEEAQVFGPADGASVNWAEYAFSTI